MTDAVGRKLERGMEGLRIAALGPLRAWRGERQLDTGPAQQRAVLTSLTLRRGQVASAHELMQDVWGSDAPASAHVAVRNHVSRLRTSSGPWTVPGCAPDCGRRPGGWR
ncbi:AfsR/SARP family transcriptional regulator [Streptomyces noursei]|uniref:AfsR/SARP family transcriptional regulator n=1 Tax=Streptomyces noursei TaxID=1971 RepID=UPI0037F5D2EC